MDPSDWVKAGFSSKAAHTAAGSPGRKAAVHTDEVKAAYAAHLEAQAE